MLTPSVIPGAIPIGRSPILVFIWSKYTEKNGFRLNNASTKSEAGLLRTIWEAYKAFIFI